MLTDTHAHLHFDKFKDDLPEVIRRAETAGIIRILTLGTERISSKESVEIASKYEAVYAAIGIHPTDVNKSENANSRALKELAQQENKVVAIGEIGLDLYWKEVPLKDQLPVFEKMLALADELHLPVVIHNRAAQKEMQTFFRSLCLTSLNGVMHSFAGSVDDARFYLELGMYISFTGVITFKNYKEGEVIKEIPLNRLLLETDSPFLAPVPKRGKRNEPAFVEFTARKLAEIYQISLPELASITRENADRLLNWE